MVCNKEGKQWQYMWEDGWTANAISAGSAQFNVAWCASALECAENYEFWSLSIQIKMKHNNQPGGSSEWLMEVDANSIQQQTWSNESESDKI